MGKPKAETTEPRGSSEAEYIRLTDLTKLRIARHIVYDVMPRSLPERDQITRQLAKAIHKLEGVNDDG